MNFFEKIVEWFFMIRLALAPTLLGVIVGGYFYLTATSSSGIIIGIAIAVVGLILGILLVIRVKKKQTATEFISRVMATPELDKTEKKEN